MSATTFFQRRLTCIQKDIDTNLTLYNIVQVTVCAPLIFGALCGWEPTPIYTPVLCTSVHFWKSGGQAGLPHSRIWGGRGLHMRLCYMYTIFHGLLCIPPNVICPRTTACTNAYFDSYVPSTMEFLMYLSTLFPFPLPILHLDIVFLVLCN